VAQRLVGGDPGEVIVDVLDKGIEISAFGAVWTGPHRLEVRRCKECGKTKPPEWMHGKALCQGCAERNHGIV
jgi:hypothetical protein